MKHLIATVISFGWAVFIQPFITMWALSHLYTLFIAPLGVMTLNRYQMYGIAVVLNFVTYHFHPSNDKDPDAIGHILSHTLHPAMTVLLAHIIVYFWFPA